MSIVLASVCGVVGASRLGDRGAVRPRARGVVVISIDTLRADALDPDGSGASRLPSLDALAEEGTRFTGVVAPSSWTGPSLASLMTGLVSLRHGFVEPVESARLPAGVPTVAAMLRAAGWSTWASTGGGWASTANGLGAGFDHFGEDFDAASPSEAVGRWSEGRPADRPFFLWLHTYVAHDPYGNKDVMRGRSPDDPEVIAGKTLAVSMGNPDPVVAARLRREFVVARVSSPARRQGLESVLRLNGTWRQWLHFLPWMSGGWRSDPEDVAAVAAIRDAYRENLRAVVDRRVRETLDALAAATPMRDVTVFVVSDHGEAFGEHDVIGHGSRLTEEMVRIPIVVRGPGFPKGSTIAAPCGLIDVAPTILDLAGLPSWPGLDGRSLLGLAAGREGGRPVESFILPLAVFAPADEAQLCRVSVRDRGTTWLAAFDIGAKAWVEEAWFDRRADPREHKALAAPPEDPAGTALRDAVASARLRVERRYGQPVPRVAEVTR